MADNACQRFVIFKMRLDVMLRQLFIAVTLCGLISVPAVADDDEEREEMFDARRSGAILPLAEILERLRPRIGDRIVEIEFERDDGMAVYEIYFLDERGRRREVDVDAATAEIIGTRKDN
jgi:uncharacterized membrane protein YkoI